MKHTNYSAKQDIINVVFNTREWFCASYDNANGALVGTTIT